MTRLAKLTRPDDALWAKRLCFLLSELNTFISMRLRFCIIYIPLKINIGGNYIFVNCFHCKANNSPSTWNFEISFEMN